MKKRKRKRIKLVASVAASSTQLPKQFSMAAVEAGKKKKPSGHQPIYISLIYSIHICDIYIILYIYMVLEKENTHLKGLKRPLTSIFTSPSRRFEMLKAQSS